MYEYVVIIDRVVDGDTVDVHIDLGFGVWLRDQRVRLHDIDTPECRTRDIEEKFFGLAAKDFVTQMLPEGSTQIMFSKSYDNTGKFGRILADFRVFDFQNDRVSNLTEVLINVGHAVKYNGDNRDLVQQYHLENRHNLFESGMLSRQDFEKFLAQ